MDRAVKSALMEAVALEKWDLLAERLAAAELFDEMAAHVKAEAPAAT